MADGGPAGSIVDGPDKVNVGARVEQRRRTIALEFWDFLCGNKKWWLTSVVMVWLLLGILILFGRSDGAPFIYTLY